SPRRPTMPTLERSGVHIYYEAHGSGPAMLLTSGYSATAEMWKPNIAALSQRYRLILWDMRGHGQTDSPDDPALYSEEATVADMAALLDLHGVEQAVIGGLSLGGDMSPAVPPAHPPRRQGPPPLDTRPGGKRREPPAGREKKGGRDRAGVRD